VAEKSYRYATRTYSSLKGTVSRDFRPRFRGGLIWFACYSQCVWINLNRFLCTVGGRCSGSDSSTCLLGWTSLTTYLSGMLKAMTATVIALPFQVGTLAIITEPKSQDAKHRGFTRGSSPFYKPNEGGVNPGLNPGFGVLRCGPRCTITIYKFTTPIYAY
jgi:hypothetical protein